MNKTQSYIVTLKIKHYEGRFVQHKFQIVDGYLVEACDFAQAARDAERRAESSAKVYSATAIAVRTEADNALAGHLEAAK